MNSLWLVTTALAAFLVAYRFYGAFLATRVVVLNDDRTTPAHRLEDGVDYHPTKRLVLFGHHFAAIAGPGPLIGPVLASQWGYFPGFSWIIVGACLAGGVHDFVILTASVRNDGLTLPKLARNLIGPVAGITTSVATLFIIIAVLASVAIVVVNALSHSPWGMFTIMLTVPAALLTGAWMYKIRPGHIGEASVIGVTIVMLGVVLGKPFAESFAGSYLLFSKETLSLMLPIYAVIASILPVWVLMCPRDYLSSYMKIGVIAMLAAGIFIAQPHLKMPATTPYLWGGGPVFSGAIWPYVCIVIMCGALSGFHALISSGTTPKMINKESDIRPIGYGGMVLEGFVALVALIAACSLEPGDYFKINIAQDNAQQKAHYAKVVQTAKADYGWDISPKEFDWLEEGTGEKAAVAVEGASEPAKKAGEQTGLAGRVGGAVTLAVGMAKVFASLPGMQSLMSYWYHFVIMFEALFILTLLETGTRVARFVFQETLSQVNPKFALGHKPNWALNAVMSVVVCVLWGGLLRMGDLETLWRMLGIANQLLATIALCIGTTYLLLHASKRRYALCTSIPLVLVVVTVFTASVQSIQGWWLELGTLAPGSPKIFYVRLLCVLASVMLGLATIVVLDSLRRWYVILSSGGGKPDDRQKFGRPAVPSDVIRTT